MGLWSSIVTLQFFEHGAKALETDKDLQALALAAALLFVFGEMAAFTLPALLPGRALQARRWMLYGFAGAVLAIEVFTISAVQMAMVSGADLTQTSVADNVADLQKQIATVEANAKTYAATAESLRAADQLKKATAYADKATAEQAKASQLYDRLEKARTQKRPTLTGLLGEKTALSYAIARGVLVALSGLVFFGTAGALLHAARGGSLSVDQQILALLHELRGTPGAPAAPVLHLVKPAPAESEEETPAPAAKAPAKAPEDEKQPFGFIPATSKLTATSNDTPVIVDTPPPVIVDTCVIDTPVNDDTPALRPRTPRAPRSERGEIMDTGTGEHDGHRFRRALALIKAGQARPSQDGLFKAVRASRPVADRYLAAWAAAGLIEENPDGPGWVLAKKGGAA
jgi:hypothetical protein